MNKLEDSIVAFNHAAATYDHDAKGEHARKLYPYMLEEIRSTYAPVLLDLGCGSGELMKLVLDEDPQRHITGLDISEEMLRIAQEKLHDRITLVKGNAQQLPFVDATFDMVYCNDSFHHYPDPKLAVQELQRVLKPQGRVIIGESWMMKPGRFLMNLYYHFSREGDVRMYSQKELKNLLAPYFHDIRCKKTKDHAIVITGVKN